MAPKPEEARVRYDGPDRGENGDYETAGGMSCGMSPCGLVNWWAGGRSLGHRIVLVLVSASRLSGDLQQTGEVRSVYLDQAAGLAITSVHCEAVTRRERAQEPQCARPEKQERTGARRGRSPERTNMPARWASLRLLVLTDSHLAGLLWERQYERFLLAEKLEESTKMGILIHASRKRSFFLCICGRQNMAVKKKNLKTIQRQLRKNKDPASPLDRECMGSTQRECKTDKRNVEEHRKLFESSIPTATVKPLPSRERSLSDTMSWSYDMERDEKKCVERFCSEIFDTDTRIPNTRVRHCARSPLRTKKLATVSASR